MSYADDVNPVVITEGTLPVGSKGGDSSEPRASPEVRGGEAHEAGPTQERPGHGHRLDTQPHRHTGQRESGQTSGIRVGPGGHSGLPPHGYGGGPQGGVESHRKRRQVVQGVRREEK